MARQRNNIIKTLGLSSLLVTALLTTASAAAKIVTKPTEQLIKDFVAAHNAVYQPNMTDQDLDRYIGFLSSELTDFHAAYNVTMNGTEDMRKNFKTKQKDSVRYQATVEDIIIGSYL